MVLRFNLEIPLPTTQQSPVIRSLKQNDAVDWRRLFEAYGKFYNLQVSEEAMTEVWSWLFDEREDFWCSVAEIDNEIVGFTQFQLMHRSLSGGKVVYLSDLYVTPEIRAGGVGRTLIDHVFEFARERNIDNVRWLTQDFNYTARRLYDTYQSKSDFVLYSVPV